MDNEGDISHIPKSIIKKLYTKEKTHDPYQQQVCS